MQDEYIELFKEDKFLEFRELPPKPKTRVFQVWSKCSDIELGKIWWYSQWRHYTFVPSLHYTTVYSDRCLISIGEFITKLNIIHKKEVTARHSSHK